MTTKEIKEDVLHCVLFEGFERTDVDAIIGILIENHKLHQETNVSCHWRLGNFIIQYYET